MNALAKIFEGEPKTEVTVEGNQTSIKVILRHLRPSDAEGIDALAMLIALGAVGASLWITWEMMAITAPAVGLFAGGLFGRPLLQWKMRTLGKATATVKFVGNAILFQKAPQWAPETGWQTFERHLPHRFLLIEHDHAQAEKDEIDFRARNNPGQRIARYYSDSWFVVLEYLGQRYDLAEVMGRRQAKAILDRLILCDDYMKGLDNAAKKLPMKPEDEWSASPGSIPE